MIRRIVLFLALLLAGCTSVPHASRERDAEAKQFLTHPNSATLYVYRTDFPVTGGQGNVLFVGTRLIGSTLARTFFRIDLPAGDHVLRGQAPDQGRLQITAPSGEITFISLNVTGGHSMFRQVDAETGQREILRCCVMLENWAPGQRPLLR
jgi:hypothetical protein